MAWEWVAPVATATAGAAGVFFTWLTGNQSRQHLERLTRHADEKAQHERSLRERRNAYLAALEVCRWDLARARYERKREHEKLAQVEKSFPKGERVRRTIEARIAVELFGSREAGRIAEEWYVAAGEGEERMRAVYDDFVELARKELDTTAFERWSDSAAPDGADGLGDGAVHAGERLRRPGSESP